MADLVVVALMPKLPRTDPWALLNSYRQAGMWPQYNSLLLRLIDHSISQYSFLTFPGDRETVVIAHMAREAKDQWLTQKLVPEDAP